MIAYTQLCTSLACKQSALVPDLDNSIFRRALRLAVKEVCHRSHGIELVLLVRVELEFHTPEIVLAGVRE